MWTNYINITSFFSISIGLFIFCNFWYFFIRRQYINKKLLKNFLIFFVGFVGIIIIINIIYFISNNFLLVLAKSSNNPFDNYNLPLGSSDINFNTKHFFNTEKVEIISLIKNENDAKKNEEALKASGNIFINEYNPINAHEFNKYFEALSSEYLLNSSNVKSFKDLNTFFFVYEINEKNINSLFEIFKFLLEDEKMLGNNESKAEAIKWFFDYFPNKKIINLDLSNVHLVNEYLMNTSLEERSSLLIWWSSDCLELFKLNNIDKEKIDNLLFSYLDSLTKFKHPPKIQVLFHEIFNAYYNNTHPGYLLWKNALPWINRDAFFDYLTYISSNNQKENLELLHNWIVTTIQLLNIDYNIVNFEISKINNIIINNEITSKYTKIEIDKYLLKKEYLTNISIDLEKKINNLKIALFQLETYLNLNNVIYKE